MTHHDHSADHARLERLLGFLAQDPDNTSLLIDTLSLAISSQAIAAAQTLKAHVTNHGIDNAVAHGSTVDVRIEDSTNLLRVVVEDDEACELPTAADVLHDAVDMKLSRHVMDEEDQHPDRAQRQGYADQQGLFNVAQSMKRFAQNPHDDASFWQPAPLLARLVAEGKSFT